MSAAAIVAIGQTGPMFMILGLVGSLFMVALEAFSATDIGYWWATVPAIVGLLFQPFGGNALIQIVGPVVELICGIFGD